MAKPKKLDVLNLAKTLKTSWIKLTVKDIREKKIFQIESTSTGMKIEEKIQTNSILANYVIAALKKTYLINGSLIYIITI